MIRYDGGIITLGREALKNHGKPERVASNNTSFALRPLNPKRRSRAVVASA
jgi:hypothetical protein